MFEEGDPGSRVKDSPGQGKDRYQKAIAKNRQGPEQVIPVLSYSEIGAELIPQVGIKLWAKGVYMLEPGRA